MLKVYKYLASEYDDNTAVFVSKKPERDWAEMACLPVHSFDVRSFNTYIKVKGTAPQHGKENEWYLYLCQHRNF